MFREYIPFAGSCHLPLHVLMYWRKSGKYIWINEREKEREIVLLSFNKSCGSELFLIEINWQQRFLEKFENWNIY